MDWTLLRTAAGKGEELPHNEQGFGKPRGCSLWRPLKLALLTHGWNPCTSAAGGGKSNNTENLGKSKLIRHQGLTGIWLCIWQAVSHAEKSSACQEFQDTDSGLLEQLTTGQWPIKGMGMLSRIKSLLSSTRPILFLFSKGNFKALQGIRGVQVLFTFPRQYSFLAWHQLHSHSNYWRAYQTACHEKYTFQLFPLCMAEFRDLNKFLTCCLFWDRALQCTHFPSTSTHGRLVQWAGSTHKLRVSLNDFTMNSGSQALECDSLSDMG